VTAQLNATIVLPEPPLREGRASGRCVIAMLRGLRMHGVDVRALAARQSFAVPGEPPPDVRVEIVDVPPERPGWRARLRRLRRPVGELARSDFAGRVREAARSADVLHLEEIQTAWLDEHTQKPALLHLHYFVRWDRPLGRPWRREFRHALEFELAERAAVRRHSIFIAASPLVAAELRRRRPDAEVVIVPLCLDPADYPRAPLDGPPVAGIIGTAAWPPTASAMRRLANELWPAVLRQVPDARLRVAGRGTDQLGLGGAGVEVVGEVPSAVDFLRGLSLLLYPVDRGSGVKVKTLESVAVGLPVVTTPLGAEGVEVGEGMVIETDLPRLASAAASILHDGDERRQRGQAARQAFLERYGPVPATQPLVELYRRLA
jgi:glycosyltransferase involved in cell wall biosynthesis